MTTYTFTQFDVDQAISRIHRARDGEKFVPGQIDKDKAYLAAWADRLDRWAALKPETKSGSTQRLRAARIRRLIR